MRWPCVLFPWLCFPLVGFHSLDDCERVRARGLKVARVEMITRGLLRVEASADGRLMRAAHDVPAAQELVVDDANAAFHDQITSKMIARMMPHAAPTKPPRRKPTAAKKRMK